MSKNWTKEELSAASKMMKQTGHMGFKEFCQAIEQKQPVRFDLRERDWTNLVKDISEILGKKAEYLRTPSCACRIGDYTIAKDGTLTWDTDMTEAEILLQALTDRGWRYAIMIDAPAPDEMQPAVTAESDTGAYDFCVELPEEALPDAARANLDRIIESKGNLLQKALGTDTLSYEIADGKVRFPWFRISGSPEDVTAYTQLITALVEMAKNSKRVTAKARPVENQKYAFRCFLTRLGFIGDAYKTSRKILLKNLDGNSAFRDKK